MNVVFHLTQYYCFWMGGPGLCGPPCPLSPPLPETQPFFGLPPAPPAEWVSPAVSASPTLRQAAGDGDGRAGAPAWWPSPIRVGGGVGAARPWPGLVAGEGAVARGGKAGKSGRHGLKLCGIVMDWHRL